MGSPSSPTASPLSFNMWWLLLALAYTDSKCPCKQERKPNPPLTDKEYHKCITTLVICMLLLCCIIKYISPEVPDYKMCIENYKGEVVCQNTR